VGAGGVFADPAALAALRSAVHAPGDAARGDGGAAAPEEPRAEEAEAAAARAAAASPFR